eukprot:CAMPEP_0118646506 /NCGR_PEP_ID=MMETSP0785-20121206/8094_1 /TAXON_ID=91992 /ORGANISM="Bolidomonas pacifica, Strain CCMP 1866" /LENGTH=346 /DNA_ID=CAMNT_0006538507 /DNA_START=49 /DNA_END=1085 /DNA_ORIENTATION=+
MPLLIISVGQGGINPLRVYWEDNKQVIRRDGIKKRNNNDKKKNNNNNRNNNNNNNNTKARGRERVLPPSTPPTEPSIHPYLPHYYHQNLWTKPRWIAVDSELKVVNNLQHLLLKKGDREERVDEGEEERRKVRNSFHLSRFTVKSHSGMGGCWGRGYFRSCGNVSVKRVKGGVDKNVGNVRVKEVKEGRVEGRRKIIGTLEVGKSSTNPSSPPPSPTLKIKSCQPKPPKQPWKDNFTRTKPKESSTEEIMPTLAEAADYHLRVMEDESISISSTPPSILLTHSLTGGTGSGCTSRILEYLRDENPKRGIYTYSVTPFGRGGRVTDSTGPLSSYNSLLCMVHLQGLV